MAFSDFLGYIVPPKDAGHVTQWRWAIFGCVVALIANGMAGRGFLGGYGSYAAASDVRVILELQIARELRDIQEQKCRLPVHQRRALESVIEDYQRRYREITGKRYPLPPCPSPS